MAVASCIANPDTNGGAAMRSWLWKGYRRPASEVAQVMRGLQSGRGRGRRGYIADCGSLLLAWAAMVRGGVRQRWRRCSSDWLRANVFGAYTVAEGMRIAWKTVRWERRRRAGWLRKERAEQSCPLDLRKVDG